MTAYIAHTLNTVARARGMSQIAKDAGITREGFYKALGLKISARVARLSTRENLIL